jgi:FtsZ-binding cell division protein ZapB
VAEAVKEKQPELDQEEALQATKKKLQKRRNRVDKEHTKVSEQNQTAAFRSSWMPTRS